VITAADLTRHRLGFRLPERVVGDLDVGLAPGVGNHLGVEVPATLPSERETERVIQDSYARSPTLSLFDAFCGTFLRRRHTTTIDATEPIVSRSPVADRQPGASSS
jgi:hypothetical protein